MPHVKKVERSLSSVEDYSSVIVAQGHICKKLFICFVRCEIWISQLPNLLIEDNYVRSTGKWFSLLLFLNMWRSNVSEKAKTKKEYDTFW